MNRSNRDPSSTRPEEEIRVGGGTERVAHDEKRNILLFRIGENFVCAGFNELAVCDDYGATVVFLLSL